ncbi:unnamed protein product [Polarella glacialis]|uniref:Uncharacterized protein n=1 Tax=Polarella glacialis TaxID=89957 RepID=A0A813FTC1_POLGL|nr:unnamed protein product [Polarella glacialis]
MRLYLSGPVLDKYELEGCGGSSSSSSSSSSRGSSSSSWLMDYVFIVLFARSICNDSDSLSEFLALWEAQQSCLLNSSSFKLDVALEILHGTRRCSGRDTGFGTRMTPQNHLGLKGDAVELGVQWLTSVQKVFRTHCRAVAKFLAQPEAAKAETLQFFSGTLLCGGGFFKVVCARDL